MGIPFLLLITIAIHYDTFIKRENKIWNVLAFLLLLVSYFLIFVSTRQLKKETNQMMQSYSVINKLNELNITITEAEAAVGGYIVTKNENFLKRFYWCRRVVSGIYQELSHMPIQDANIKLWLDKLQFLIKESIPLLSSCVDSFQRNNMQLTEKTAQNWEKTRDVVNSIRWQIADMAETESILMKEKKSNLSGFFSNTKIITLLSLLIAVVAILYSLITYNHESKAKSEAHKKVKQYGEELENNILQLKDINTELKELRSLEKFAATGRMARTMAHEIRNPLTNISLAAQQLQEMAITNPDSSMLLDMIARNTVRINQLVADVLNATKFAHLDMQKANINQLLDEALEMARDRVNLTHVVVEKYYSPDICDVLVDREKIKIAFLNIIVNAIEAMEKSKGILQLKTKKENDKCIVEIKDNGLGMEEPVLHKLFEPYFTSKPKGSGLGLTNTQNIILNHKGRIKVLSQKREGTVFVIILNLFGTA